MQKRSISSFKFIVSVFVTFALCAGATTTAPSNSVVRLQNALGPAVAKEGEALSKFRLTIGLHAHDNRVKQDDMTAFADDPIVALAIAKSYWRQQDIPKVEALLEPIRARFPRVALVNVYLGKCAVWRRDLATGIRLLNEALAIDPYCVEAHFELATLATSEEELFSHCSHVLSIEDPSSELSRAAVDLVLRRLDLFRGGRGKTPG